MQMRMVLMGTPFFAVPSLQMLCHNGYQVAGVITQPDRPKGRSGKSVPSPEKQAALLHGLPVLQPEKIRRDGVEALTALAPDLCVTAAYGQILSRQILDIPKLGTINIHASLLPKHRGSAPVAWGLMMGDDLFGVTTMMTDAGIDTGDILLQRALRPFERETCGELTERLSYLGAELLAQTLTLLAEGRLTRTPQDHDAHTYEPPLTKEMSVVNWSNPAHETVNLIHGLNPWPAARTGAFKFLRAEAVQAEQGCPGEVLFADTKNGLVIKASQGAVRILEMQADGGKPMAAVSYLAGHPIQKGVMIHAASIHR